MEKKKEQEEKTPVIVDGGLINNFLTLLERGFKLIKDVGILKFVTYTLVLAIVSLFFYFAFNPTKMFELYDTWKAKQHTYLMEMRMDNAPKIQNLIDKLTFKVDASRTIILELHNGSDGMGGLPFTKCSATYESLNIGAHPVSAQYQNQNMSLIPFTSFIFDKGYWCGNTEDLLQLDRGLYHKMKSNNTEHFAACVIEGIDKPIAILMVSFDKIPDEGHDCEIVRENIRHIALETAVFLEVDRLVREGKVK